LKTFSSFGTAQYLNQFLCTMTAGRNALSKGVQELWERSHAPVMVNTLANKWIAQLSSAQHSTARHNKSCEHKALQKVNVRRITKLLLYHKLRVPAVRFLSSVPRYRTPPAST